MVLRGKDNEVVYIKDAYRDQYNIPEFLSLEIFSESINSKNVRSPLWSSGKQHENNKFIGTSSVRKGRAESYKRFY